MCVLSHGHQSITYAVWTDADLAIAIVETCGDPSTQIECLDDTPECYYIGEEPDPGAGLAFSTNPVAMVGGKTYSVYLG